MLLEVVVGRLWILLTHGSRKKRDFRSSPLLRVHHPRQLEQTAVKTAWARPQPVLDGDSSCAREISQVPPSATIFGATNLRSGAATIMWLTTKASRENSRVASQSSGSRLRRQVRTDTLRLLPISLHFFVLRNRSTYSLLRSITTRPTNCDFSILSNTSLNLDMGSTVKCVLITPRAAMFIVSMASFRLPTALPTIRFS